MKIGIHTKELENARIDGTMVYLSNVLSHMLHMIGDDVIYAYHTGPYHAQVSPHAHDHLCDRILPRWPLWTQTQCATAVWRDNCDALWMPIHNMPLIRRAKMRTIVTVHDMAFQYFPETYLRADRLKLMMLTKHAVKNADDIIAISASTKKDLLACYPFVQEQRIHVIHHGFDPQIWQKEDAIATVDHILNIYDLAACKYIIHVGAVQPRKNLTMLVDAFSMIKEKYPHLKLVLVGGDGWLAHKIHAHIAGSRYKKDIVVTGNISFDAVRVLMRHAVICVLPSLYEGFGMPGLEAMAAGVPVAAAHNSCFPEVLGDSAVYFDAQHVDDCFSAMYEIMTNEEKTHKMIMRAQERSAMFSWETCAQKTLAVIRGIL